MFQSGYYNRKNLSIVKVGNYFGKTYVNLRIYGCSHLSVLKQVHVKISEKRLHRLGNYDPRNLLVGSLFLLKITSLSKAPPSPWLRHPPEPQIKNIKVNKVIAQGSRRCTFSIDTVDESKSRSKGARKVLPKDHGFRSCASLHCSSTPSTNRGIDLGAEDTGKVQTKTPQDMKVLNKFRHCRRVEEPIKGCSGAWKSENKYVNH